MGYYSEVGLCLHKDNLKLFDSKLSSHYASELQSVGALLECAEHITDTTTDAELWHWKTVKWYSDDQEIGFMETLMSDMDMEKFLFIRIGEDSDDNEVIGCWWDNPFGLCLERNINFERPAYGNR